MQSGIRHGLIKPASQEVLSGRLLSHCWAAPFRRCNRSPVSRLARRRRHGPECNFRSDSPSSGDWEQSDSVVMILTPDGILRFPIGSPSQDPAALRRWESISGRSPLPSWEEQGLCIGATFTVAATNGRDPSRRIHLRGFCRSIEMLSEVVEDSVLRRGGEVVRRKCDVKSSMHESLQLTVAIPFLFGVPPAHEMLSDAIVLGGGFVDRVQRQWHMY